MARAGTLVLGHRGGRGVGWPAENTMAAFERAHGEGADGVELDVRLCASGEVVVFHDPDLMRATGGQDARAIESLTMSELARVRLFAGAEHAPGLAEVLRLCRERDLMLNVEMKHDVGDKLALARAVVRELAGHAGPVIVSSFDPRLLWLARWAGMRAPTAVLTHQKQRHAMICVRALAHRPFAAGVHFERMQADRCRSARAHRRGLFAGAWTVNEPAEARALAAAGIDWLISDAPGLIRRALSGP